MSGSTMAGDIGSCSQVIVTALHHFLFYKVHIAVWWSTHTMRIPRLLEGGGGIFLLMLYFVQVLFSIAICKDQVHLQYIVVVVQSVDKTWELGLRLRVECFFFLPSHFGLMVHIFRQSE